MRLIYNNLWDNFTLVESQEDANYPVENTQDIRLAKVWRTETASAASVVITAGSAGLFVFQATTNLLENTDNLALFTTSGSIVTSSGLFYDGSEFAKVQNAATAAGFIYQNETATAATTTPSGNVICRKGSSVGNTAQMIIYNLTGSANVFDLTIDFDNHPDAPGTTSSGVLRWYDWIDEETIEIHYTCSALAAATNDIQYRLYGSPNATGSEYTYWMRPQLEGLDYDTPYVNGLRAVTHPDETFEMPSQFIIDMELKSWFTYDVGIDRKYISWYIDGTHFMRIFYHRISDFIGVEWIDGGTGRFLTSPTFDDGTAEIDINQRLRILVSIDVTTGGIATGSRLIIIPLESGAISEDTSWSGNIDALSSTFSTLSIGHEDDLLQADSQFEYVRIYAGNLVGTVGDSDDADALLAEKELILDKTYLNKLTADSAAILNHNLSADATIKIQGNDFDSWNGPPLDTTMAWREDTIVTYMSSASYPFWRFYITNQNVDDGYFEVGRFMLGEYLQVDPSSLVEFPEKHPRNDRQAFSKSNQFYADQGSGWRELKYKFVNTNNTMKDKIETMWNLNGKHTPLLLMNYDTSFSVIEPLYCAIIKDITFGHLLHDRWEYNLDLRECD